MYRRGINRVTKNMRMYFEMGTDGHRFHVFSSELVDFEGTFGGYLYNCFCSSDVCNIPIKWSFFFFHGECVIEPQH